MSIPMRSTHTSGFSNIVEGSRFAVELISSYGDSFTEKVASLKFLETRSEARTLAASSLGVPAAVFSNQNNGNIIEDVDADHPAWNGHIMAAKIIANNSEDAYGNYAHETLRLEYS